MITREAATMADVQCRSQYHRNCHHVTSKWVIMILAVALTGIVRVAGDATTDKTVLEAFKRGITNSADQGWSDSNPCNWKGVTCDAAGNVQMLRVKNFGLTGTVTSDLHTLTSLTMLELNYNSFTSAMPTLQGMAALQQAFLDDNNFDSIPIDFFEGLTSITEIWIDNNPLNKSSGGWLMPSAMKDAASTLTLLSMNNVSATGQVPAYLGTMPALKVFNAAYNSFSGTIPTSFQTSGITTLVLNNQAGTKLSGGVDFIGGMVGLTKLYLHGNSFTGPVPDGITSAAGLSTIRLSANYLVGRLPLALGNLNFIGKDAVWMAGNFFSGEQPVFPTGSFMTPSGQQVTYCAEPGVKCSSKVDALLDFLSAALWPQKVAETWVGADPCAAPWQGVACDATGEVTSITLIRSGLAGTLSSSLAKLPSLSNLVVSGNALTGPIPTELTTLTSLTKVDVSNNNLSGPLPAFPASVTFIYTGNALLDASPPPAVPPPVTPPAAPPATPPVPPPATPPVPPPATPPVPPPATPPVPPPATPPVPPPATPPVPPPATPPVPPPATSPVPPPATPPVPPPVTPPVPPPVAPPVTPPVALPPSNPPSIAPTIAPSPRVIPPVSAPTPVGIITPSTAPTPASIAPGRPSPTPAIVLPPGSSPAPTAAIPATSKNKSIVGPVVGAVVGGIVLTALGFWFLCFYCKKRDRKKRPTRNQQLQPGVFLSTGTTADPEFIKLIIDSGSTNGNHPRDAQVSESWNMGFSIDQLRAVTEDFAERNVLGRGGFGVVYKGVLPDGTKIAVKRMEAAVVRSKGLSEFQSEIAVLTKVKHRHLVGLLGYCTDGIERLLVYEYMSQGTLSQHLFKHEGITRKPLSWTTRLVIALDVAQGVDYLHSLAHRSFIHRDLKPSNVLLNDDFRAKVSDFGLVKLAPEGNYHSVETRLAGTFGYLAPEYAVTGRVTTKVDVFSFGVILMELLTGRRAVDETQSEEDMYLVSWFTNKMRSRQEKVLRSTIDPTIRDIDDETTFKSISTVAELAGHCTVREPGQRPDMGHVVSVLRHLVDEWKPMQMDYDTNTQTNMSLAKALKQWQESGDSSMTGSTMTDNSVSSLPARPRGFANSFASADGR